MLNLGLAGTGGGLSKVLCLGAHSDDIEIGCGGTLLQLVRSRPDVEVRWVVFSAEGARSREAKASAREFLAGTTRAKILTRSFRNAFFPFQGAAIKEHFEELKAEFEPDLVFTHYRDDRHQDHRTLSDLTWNTFRNHLILEYEIPKYDGDLGTPNIFVPLDTEVCQEKVRLLAKHFRTQSNKHWFTEDLFLGLMRLRGVECGARYAEGFFGRKVVLQ